MQTPRHIVQSQLVLLGLCFLACTAAQGGGGGGNSNKDENRSTRVPGSLEPSPLMVELLTPGSADVGSVATKCVVYREALKASLAPYTLNFAPIACNITEDGLLFTEEPPAGAGNFVRFLLSTSWPKQGTNPSVSRLFDSIAEQLRLFVSVAQVPCGSSMQLMVEDGLLRQLHDAMMCESKMTARNMQLAEAANVTVLTFPELCCPNWQQTPSPEAPIVPGTASETPAVTPSPSSQVAALAQEQSGLPPPGTKGPLKDTSEFSPTVVAVVASLAGAAMLSMLVTVAVLWHRRMLCFNRAGGGLPTKELPGSPLYTMGSGDSPGTLCADPPPSVQITVDGGATTSSLPSSEQQSVSAAGPSTSLISGVAARALQASPEQSRRTPLQQPQPAATAARRPDPELPTPFAVAMPPTTIGLVDLFGAAMFGAPGLPASKAASSTNLPPYGAGPLAQRYESAPAAVGPEDSQAVLSHLSAPEDSGIVNKLRQTLSSGAAEQQRDGSPRGPRSSDSSQLVDMDPRELQVKADGLLGQGAFGSVYRGIYQGQEVAIKVLSHVQVAGDPLMHEKDVEAFRHELRLLSQLSHPNIVRVLGGCAHRSHPFLVMELMPACLHTLIHSTQPLPVRRVLEIAKDVANGLEFLHPEIIHRDLKPANILLDSSGVAKISDFGLARCKIKPYLSTRQPDAGSVVYMAPECFDPAIGGLSAKCDVYAFGVLLWEMLTREHPWAGDSNVAIIYKVAVRRQHLELPKASSYSSPPDHADNGGAGSSSSSSSSSQAPAERSPSGSGSGSGSQYPCYPQPVVDLLEACFAFTPSDRPTMEQVLQRIDACLAVLP